MTEIKWLSIDPRNGRWSRIQVKLHVGPDDFFHRRSSLGKIPWILFLEEDSIGKFPGLKMQQRMIDVLDMLWPFMAWFNMSHVYHKSCRPSRIDD